MIIKGGQCLSNEQLALLATLRDENRNDYLTQLFLQNKGLIYRIIQPYIGINGNDADDLMQDSFIAVIECVDHYDPDKGQFTTLLPYWVKNTIFRTFYSGNALRLPEYLRTRIGQYTRFCDEFQKRYGEPPADIYIKMRLKLTQDQLDDIRIIINQRNTESLDKPITESLTVADSVADDRDIIGNMIDQVDRKQASRELWSEVDALEPEQRSAIRAKYLEDLTVQEVADRLHLTKSQANRAISKGCKNLKRKKKIKQVGEVFGYTSHDLYGGGLQSFLNSGSSIVELAIIRKLEGKE